MLHKFTRLFKYTTASGMYWYSFNIKNRFLKCFLNFFVNTWCYSIREFKRFVLFLAHLLNKICSKNFYKFDNTNQPLVSIIVPNYNHSKYLRQRLDSIYKQSYKNIEVLLLDDCSTDNSREILIEYKEKYPLITKTIFNTEKSKGVFFQWKKGLDNCHGDYIWIAESDDWCSRNFLKEMIKNLIRNKSCLCFARTYGILNNKKIWSQNEYASQIDMKWNTSFTMPSLDFLYNGFAWQCLIPNASGVVFKRIDFSPLIKSDSWLNLRMVGDWVLYLFLLANNDCISYSSYAYNYHRFHNSNTSLLIDRSLSWYTDYKYLTDYIANNFKIDNTIYLNNLYIFLLHSMFFDGYKFWVKSINALFNNLPILDYKKFSYMVISRYKDLNNINNFKNGHIVVLSLCNKKNDKKIINSLPNNGSLLNIRLKNKVEVLRALEIHKLYCFDFRSFKKIIPAKKCFNNLSIVYKNSEY